MTHTVAHMQVRADSCSHVLYVRTQAVFFLQRSGRAVGSGGGTRGDEFHYKKEG